MQKRKVRLEIKSGFSTCDARIKMASSQPRVRLFQQAYAFRGLAYWALKAEGNQLESIQINEHQPFLLYLYLGCTHSSKPAWLSALCIRAWDYTNNHARRTSLAISGVLEVAHADWDHYTKVMRYVWTSLWVAPWDSKPLRVIVIVAAVNFFRAFPWRATSPRSLYQCTTVKEKWTPASRRSPKICQLTLSRHLLN